MAQLKLVPEPTFSAPVEIRAPGGSVSIVKFEFKHRTRDEMTALMQSEEWKGKRDDEAVMLVAVGWQDVDAEFNAASLATLFQNYQGAARAVMQKYFSELTGAQLGN